MPVGSEKILLWLRCHRLFGGAEMRSIAILGDSYSTYEGFIPKDYISWYSDTGNAQENDVESVNDTWWKILCDELNLELILNSSYSGSAVCLTGYPRSDGVLTSFVYRMHRDFGAHFVELKEIDKQNGHPSKLGMRKIVEQIKPILLR